MRRIDLVSRVLMTFLVLTVACSADSTRQGADLSLVIGNTDVRSVQYSIVCEGGATFTDEFEVVDDRDPPVWEAFVGLPAGENCVITLTAFDDAGNPICTGSTNVDIVEGQTVKADITMECPTTGEVGTGNVDIDGRFEDLVVDICPIIHILNAIPRVMTEPPGESSLRVQATDPESGAEVDTVLSSSSGVIDDPTAKNTGFTCTQSGPVEVTATAAAGDPNCEQRARTTLTCPDQGNACDGVDCSDGNECTTDVCDPADGSCSNPNVANGSSCAGGDGRCANGVCLPVDLCEGVDCSDGNECTQDLCAGGNCSNPNEPANTPCDGGAGSCQAGVCVPTGETCDDLDCNDGNECTADSCDDTGSSPACVHSPLDGQSCTEFPNGYCALGGSCVSGLVEADNAIACSPFVATISLGLLTTSSVSEAPVLDGTVDLTTRVQGPNLPLAALGFDAQLQNDFQLLSAEFEISVVNGTPILIPLSDPNVPRPITEGFSIDTGDVVTEVTVGAGPLLGTQLTDAQVSASAQGGVIFVQIGPGIDNCVLEGGGASFPVVP